MVTKDKQVITFASADGSMRLVICMEELDVQAIDTKVASEGTHFLTGWSARVFIKTAKGCLVIIPQ